MYKRKTFSLKLKVFYIFFYYIFLACGTALNHLDAAAATAFYGRINGLAVFSEVDALTADNVAVAFIIVAAENAGQSAAFFHQEIYKLALSNIVQNGIKKADAALASALTRTSSMESRSHFSRIL